MINNSLNKSMSWTDTAYSMGSTICTTWDHYAPQSWKTASPTTRLAIKGAVSLCLPGGALVQMAGLAATAWSENAAFAPVVQKPISVTPSFPATPIALPEAPMKIESPALSDLETITNREIEKFSKTVANYATLYTMYYLICDIKEENGEISLQEILNTATEETSSLWEIFHERYKDRLSYFQAAKAKLFFLCCYQIPIIPKATHTYLKEIVELFRDHITHNSTKQIKLIEKFIQNNTELFEKINHMITDFSGEEFVIKKEKDGQPRSLKVYIKKAVKKWLKTESDEQRLLQMTQKFLSDHPICIPFQFGEKPMNWVISKILKKWILPNLVPLSVKNLKQQLFENGKEYVSVVQKDGTTRIEKRDRAYNPFFVLITDQLETKLQELQKTLLSGSTATDSKSSIKVQGLESLTKNFVKMIHLLPLPSQQTDTKETVKIRIEGFKGKPPIVKDTEIQLIMQGAQLAVDYLSDPATLESFLTLLVASASSSFSNKITVKSEAVWQQEHDLFIKSKQKLKKITQDILTQQIHSAITNIIEDPNSHLNAANNKTILNLLPMAGMSLYCFLPPYLAAPLNGLATMALSNIDPLLSIIATPDSTKAAQIAQNMLTKAGALGLIASMIPTEIAAPVLAFQQSSQLSSIAVPAVDQAIETSKRLALNETIEMTDKFYDVVTNPLFYLANFRFFLRK